MFISLNSFKSNFKSSSIKIFSEVFPIFLKKISLSKTGSTSVVIFFIIYLFPASIEYLISTSFLDSVEPRGLNAYYRVKAINGEGDGLSQTVLSVAGEISPTVSPTAGPPCTPLTVQIVTDTYPGETTWSLVGSCNGYSKIGGPYQAQGTQYDFDDCVPFDEYTFTINDSYGKTTTAGGCV